MGGDEIPYHIILRGFKLSMRLFDTFLAANGEDTYQDSDKDTLFLANVESADHPITKLLYKKISEIDSSPDPTSFRFVVPTMRHYDCSKEVYITYAWVVIFAQRELDMDKDLPQDIPAGFEHLRQAILSHASTLEEVDKLPEEGRIGLFAVHQEVFFAQYYPQLLKDRQRPSQKCDRCSETFPKFAALMAHRRQTHGLREHNPLPDGV